MYPIHKKPGGNHRAFFLLFVLVLIVSQNKDLDEYGLQIIIVLVLVVVALEMLLNNEYEDDWDNRWGST